ncbi:GAF domain-containing protein [Salana multivorans]|uniref:GAF domain-containing protein n=1 Tax=Salana multivorans TaxID=120377 RepID=A0A3N2DD31_9MICO|nr:GAF and ANTAR domain-containing protein [Salana multivorans]ROR97632.1 GAF domain-containing protein [Salana multivorans]
MPPSNEAEQLTDAASAWHQETAAPDAGASIAASMLELIPGTAHASLTIRRQQSFHSLGSTSDCARELDQAQYVLNEGPCVDTVVDAADAVDGSPWLRSGDTAGDPRWPRWGPVAAEAGVHSVLAVRLLSGTQVIGALNLYGERPGLFTDPDDIDLAVLLATHAALALSSVSLVADLRTAVSSRHTIGIAQGILMERFGFDQEAAFALLRRISSTSNIKLRMVAQRLIATRELPIGPDDDAGVPATPATATEDVA